VCLVLLQQDFAKRAAVACGKDVTELSKSFAGLQAAHAPYFCLDLSFCHTVLTQGFDLSETAPITLVKQVRGGCYKAEHEQLLMFCTHTAVGFSSQGLPLLVIARCWQRSC
jgi:hypothetical protein